MESDRIKNWAVSIVSLLLFVSYIIAFSGMIQEIRSLENAVARLDQRVDDLTVKLYTNDERFIGLLKHRTKTRWSRLDMKKLCDDADRAGKPFCPPFDEFSQDNDDFPVLERP